VLKELGVPVYGLHYLERTSWETPGMPQVLDRFTAGDYRRRAVLDQAGIALCRAVLFTGAMSANITGALAARSLYPDVRLVIRSSQTNLNERPDQQLDNLVALESNNVRSGEGHHYTVTHSCRVQASLESVCNGDRSRRLQFAIREEMGGFSQMGHGDSPRDPR
jgi:hypothetical protein